MYRIPARRALATRESGGVSMRPGDEIIGVDERRAHVAAGFAKPSRREARPTLPIIDVCLRAVGSDLIGPQVDTPGDWLADVMHGSTVGGNARNQRHLTSLRGAHVGSD
jgi:hypothetical protein